MVERLDGTLSPDAVSTLVADAQATYAALAEERRLAMSAVGEASVAVIRAVDAAGY